MPHNQNNNNKSPYATPKTKFYRKIDRNARAKGKCKILDENIDDFISNLSPDTSDMSDDSDFEFDSTAMDNLLENCKPEFMLDLDNFEKIFDIAVKQLPPVARQSAVQLKRFVKWCNALGRANMKLCLSVYNHSSVVLAAIIHFLYLLSTSYKTVLLAIYGIIVKLDNWTDKVLDDRTVGDHSPQMSDKIREKIAESMELSKTPINAKRARELLRPAASTMSKLETTGPGDFWQWIHGVGDHATNKVKSTVNALTDVAITGKGHQKLNNDQNSNWGW